MDQHKGRHFFHIVRSSKIAPIHCSARLCGDEKMKSGTRARAEAQLTRAASSRNDIVDVPLQ